MVVGGEVFLRRCAGGRTCCRSTASTRPSSSRCPGPGDSGRAVIAKSSSPPPGGRFAPRAGHAAGGDARAGLRPSQLGDGRKISVDSATMMNKALEVIEGALPVRRRARQLEVVIHPQSVIHSMVQYRDRSVVAQLGTARHAVPIAYGLPGRRASRRARALDFSPGGLSFGPSTPGHRLPLPGPGAGLGGAAGAPGTCAGAERRQRGRGRRLPGSGASASTRSTPSCRHPGGCLATPGR